MSASFIHPLVFSPSNSTLCTEELVQFPRKLPLYVEVEKPFKRQHRYYFFVVLLTAGTRLAKPVLRKKNS